MKYQITNNLNKKIKYLKILLNTLKKPLHPNNQKTLTKKIPTSF